LPDVVTFQRLQAANHVNDFTLSAHQIQQVRDIYLDTEERLILAGGYSCRCRETESEVLITIKGLGKAKGAIHRRKELEISLPAYKPPHEWPKCPARNLVLQLTAEAPLSPLFDLQQTRVYRRMSQGELLVAQLSLDNVHTVSGNRKQRYFELEVELAPQGTQDNLTEIVSYLQDECGLTPEPKSKFERALAFINEDAPEGNLLTPQERA
ncbi:MAG: CYTH domain-containing protein, partial [Chloroflexota bacterium]|nr:CYTH domain-containing protein [Chloroflexota bacterium]